MPPAFDVDATEKQNDGYVQRYRFTHFHFAMNDVVSPHNYTQCQGQGRRWRLTLKKSSSSDGGGSSASSILRAASVLGAGTSRSFVKRLSSVFRNAL